MRKAAILICIFLIYIGLAASEPEKYEDYIVIKYLMDSEEFDRAETLLDRYLQKYPHDPFAMVEKAYILKNVKNNRQGALQLIEKSKEIYPGYYLSNYLQASILFSEYFDNQKEKQLLDRALEYIKASLEDNPDFYESYFLGGVILSEIGEYEESNRYFELLNRQHETAGAYYYQALNYNKLGDEAGEIGAYQKILEYDPGAHRILRVLSQMYLSKRDFKNAAGYLERLFLQSPGDKEITYDYLYSLFSAGETEKFMAVSSSIKISDYPLLAYAKALILTRNEKLEEAESLLKQTKDIDARARILLADIYYRKQDYFQGLLILEKINRQEQDNIYYSLLLEILTSLDMNRKIIAVFAEIKKDDRLLEGLALIDYYNIMFALANLNKLAELHQAAVFFKNRWKKEYDAVDELLAVLQVFSRGKKIKVNQIDFAPNIYLLINLYRNQKEYEMAISLLKKMIKKQKDHLDYLELADIYLEQGRFKKTENLLKRLLKKYPASLPINNFYAYFLAMQGKQLHLALKLSAYTLSKDKENSAYIDTYGYILFKSGRIPESIKYLKKAYEKAPLEPEIIDHMVDYYWLKKEYGKIIEIYEKAIDRGVDFKDLLVNKLAGIKKLISQDFQD